MTTLEDDDIECLARERIQAAAYRRAAVRAIGFARLYRTEEGPGGLRERASVAQALVWRRLANVERLLGPGLARGRMPSGADASETPGGSRHTG